MEIAGEVASYDIQRSGLILEDSLVSFLPNRPQEEPGDELPKSVEEDTIIWMPGPVTNSVCYVPNRFAFLAPETDFILESVGQSARNHEVLNRFSALITIGTLRMSNEAFFD